MLKIKIKIYKRYIKFRMSLNIVFGPMYSGKSTELIRRIKRDKIIGIKILIINSALDTRYGKNSIITHDNDRVECIQVMNLADISDCLVKNVDKIYIEEAHFFADLVDYVKQWTDIMDKHVIVFGLNGDSSRKPFGNMSSLIPLADDILFLKSYCEICKDTTEALFSKKISLVEGDQIDVGGHNKYIPVCRKHFF